MYSSLTALEFSDRYDGEELPSELERVLYRAVVVFALTHISVLELVSELCKGLVLFGERAFARG